jgi:shikimate 5-dehydrogenase
MMLTLIVAGFRRRCQLDVRAGIAGFHAPFPPTFVGEVVMKQQMTPFPQAAKEKGGPIQVGTDMLFEQIPAYIEFFGFGTATEGLRAVAQIKY